MTQEQKEFIEMIKPGAILTYQKYKVLPSLTLAQASLESGWGTSILATQAYNFFGIKWQSNCGFDKILKSTKEYKDGKWITVDAYFRKYKSIEEGIEDHGVFLTKSRYAKVLTAKDYKEAAYEVWKAGYATDPKYPEKLIDRIETYKFYEVDNMEEQVKDFQRRYDLTVDGKIGSQTKGKAQEIKTLIDYILNYQKPSSPIPSYTYRKELGADILEIDPLAIKHLWLKGSNSKPAKELAKQYPNFVNAMFFDGATQAIFRLLIEDGKIVSEIKSYDQFDKKGTFIIYNNGTCEVKTIGRDNLNTLNLSTIKLAIQGYNMDYEANGSTNLKDSMKKEGFGQRANGIDDYIYNTVCVRPAIGYNPTLGKIIIAFKSTNASGLRSLMRTLGCKLNGNTCSIGLDSGGSTALSIDSKVIFGTDRNLVSVLMF